MPSDGAEEVEHLKTLEEETQLESEVRADAKHKMAVVRVITEMVFVGE